MFYTQKDVRITVIENRIVKKINIDEIAYIESDSYVSTIYFINDKSACHISKLLKDLEGQLNKFGFIRICRNILVNLKNVISLGNQTRILTLVNGQKLTISYRCFSATKAIFIKMDNVR